MKRFETGGTTRLWTCRLAAAALLIAVAPGTVSWAEDKELFDPPGLLLTWQQDPTTTMTIDFHSEVGAQLPRASIVQYKELGGDQWHEVPGTMEAFPYTARNIHRVELTGLEPDTTYRFRFGEDSVSYKFRTMPADLSSREIRFAAGGDTQRHDGFRAICRQVMKHDPDFIALGGDLSYADGGYRAVRNNQINDADRRWRDWFNVAKDELISEEGRVVPILAGIGNHEVRRGYYTNYAEYEQTDTWRERMAPIYYNIFAFTKQPGYATMDFGDYLSMIFLDSDHTNPIEGEQTRWLEAQLSDRAARVPHIFPIHHVAAYTTVRDFDGRRKRLIREHWHPLFERYGVEIVFENHDHNYKRTYPIRAGEIDPEGVVYIGDGAFGVSGRPDRMHDPDETWYLDRAKGIRHFIMVTLDEYGRQLRMYDEHGEMFDAYPELESGQQ